MTDNAIPPDALRDAVEGKDVKAVKELLLQGADANGETDAGQTMLCLAAIGHHVETERLLIARLLIAHGADVNKQASAGMTPLTMAASWNHLEMVRLLIDKGADASMPDKEGRTAHGFAESYALEQFLKEAVHIQCQHSAVAAIAQAHTTALERQKRLKALAARPVAMRRVQP